MIDFFIKLFIKNGDDTKHPSVRAAYGKLSSFFGITCNVLLAALKFITGLLTGSVSITADAMNNLSDAVSSAVLLIGFGLSSKKADSKHPFGHGRIEYITGLIVSFAILLMGFELLTSSFSRIFESEAPDYSTLSLVILAASIVVKLCMFLFYRKIGRKISSETILASSTDSISDCAATGAVLVGAVITRLSGLNLDGFIGCAVAILIMYAGIRAAIDTAGPLLGSPPDPEFITSLEKIMRHDTMVIDIHDLIVHEYGPGNIMVSVHAEVPADKSVLEIHDSIDNLEMKIRNKLNCEITIHMDPIDTNNPEREKAAELVEKILAGIDGEYLYHDLRVVSGPTHTNILFDVVVPPEDMSVAAEITQEIKERLHASNPRYFAVVNVEQKYK